LNTFVFALDIKQLTDWSTVGATAINTKPIQQLNISELGGKANISTFDNSIILQKAIQSLNGKQGEIIFNEGIYTFKKGISISSNVVIKGKGSDKTIFEFNLGGNNDLISIQGKTSITTSPIILGTSKNSQSIKIKSTAEFKAGDYVLVKQTANHLLASNWAYNSFFQIEKIKQINGNEILLEHPLRLDFPIANQPILVKINPIENVGIEDLKIKRQDATSNQTSNIFLNYAVNCWVKGVESENTNFAHINLQSAANITVAGNYLHDAFDYGSGGKAYGVVLQLGAGNNFIFDNIVQHLRHSFLLQAEANGNVIAYNYSYNPYWTETWLPSSAAGDIVLHGNYPYANLFEGNIVQNIVIDNSHGINGPLNLFFRNRIENYGIVMNENAGENMSFIANEITGAGILKGLFNLNGNQLEFANNIKGKQQNGSVKEASLINKNYQSKIGFPNVVNSWKNEAYIRNSNTKKTINKTQKKDVNTSDIDVSKNNKIKKKTKKKCKRKKTNHNYGSTSNIFNALVLSVS